MALGGPSIYPGVLSWLGIARELTVGTPLVPVITHPLEQGQFEPEDSPRFLDDKAIRGSGFLRGPRLRVFRHEPAGGKIRDETARRGSHVVDAARFRGEGPARLPVQVVGEGQGLVSGVDGAHGSLPIVDNGGMSSDKERPDAFIQWKGTDACLDVYCTCGEQFHFDGYFAYELTCGRCGQTYELPNTLRRSWPMRKLVVNPIT